MMMKKLLCCLLAAGMAAGLCACGEKEDSKLVYAMDTVMELRVCGRGAETVLSAMEQRIKTLEELLSRTRAESEISALNDAQGARTPVSFETYSLLQAAKELSAATNGAFDVTIAPVASAWGFTEDAFRVPQAQEVQELLEKVDSSAVTVTDSGGQCLASLGAGQAVDLGGIAKGYASDCMADLLLEGDIDHACVSLGGNVLAWGTKADGTPWRVGVKDPRDTASLCGVLELETAYAVTSGGYERCFEQDGRIYHHIIDPATGYPAESDLLSVTVVMGWGQEKLNGRTGNGTVCDALSTALFVMGEEAALDFWRSGAYDFDAVLVTADGRVLVTDGLAGRFSPAEGSGYTYETVA